MFKLNLVTPEKRIVADQELEEITLPGFAGELNILPGHAPLMTTLESGLLKYRLKGQSEEELAVSGGYCQVSQTGVMVLAEHATTASEVNVATANESLKKNEQRMMNESLDDEAYAEVRQSISRMQAELELVGNRK